MSANINTNTHARTHAHTHTHTHTQTLCCCPKTAQFNLNSQTSPAQTRDTTSPVIDSLNKHKLTKKALINLVTYHCKLLPKELGLIFLVKCFGVVKRQNTHGSSVARSCERNKQQVKKNKARNFCLFGKTWQHGQNHFAELCRGRTK